MGSSCTHMAPVHPDGAFVRKHSNASTAILSFYRNVRVVLLCLVSGNGYAINSYLYKQITGWQVKQVARGMEPA